MFTWDVPCWFNHIIRLFLSAWCSGHLPTPCMQEEIEAKQRLKQRLQCPDGNLWCRAEGFFRLGLVGDQKRRPTFPCLEAHKTWLSLFSGDPQQNVGFLLVSFQNQPKRGSFKEPSHPKVGLSSNFPSTPSKQPRKN